MPPWLTAIAWMSLGLALLSAAIVTVDVVGRPQHMAIMNVVWPVTALYAGPLGLWAYFRFGVMGSHAAVRSAKRHGNIPPPRQKSRWQDYVLAFAFGTSTSRSRR